MKDVALPVMHAINLLHGYVMPEAGAHMQVAMPGCSG
jgi:hypothetical protein